MDWLFWVLLAVAAALFCVFVTLVAAELRVRRAKKKRPAPAASPKLKPRPAPPGESPAARAIHPAAGTAADAPFGRGGADTAEPAPAMEAFPGMRPSLSEITQDSTAIAMRPSLSDAGRIPVQIIDERPKDPYAGDIETLKRKYEAVKRILRIPSDAALVRRNVDVFCLTSCDIIHYCWTSSTSLYFFPQWEDVLEKLNAGGIKNYSLGDEAVLLTQTIAKSRIEAWLVRPDGGIDLKYFIKPGVRAEMALESSARKMFEEKLPEKEIGFFMKHIYPKSSQNIFDIKSEFLELKLTWERGSLSDEQYAEGKKHILLTL